MDSEEVLRRLKFWRDTLGAGSELKHEALTQAIDALAAERQRAERAEAALRPFAEAVDDAGDAETDHMDADAWEHPLAMAVKVGDFHHARAVLDEKETDDE